MHVEKVKFKKNLPFSIRIQSINRYPIHWHENITEILLPIKGSIEVIANFEYILVKEGDFWFVNNKAIHSINSSSGAIVAVFHIDLDYFEKQFEYIKYMFFRNNGFANTPVEIEEDNFDDKTRKEYKIRFKNLLINFLDKIVNNNHLSEKILDNFEFQLIYSMIYEFHWLQFLKKKDSFISPFQLDRYHRVVKFIEKNYTRKITLEDVASREFITKNYFSHFWKNISYFSFQERISYERVLKSQFFLLTTDMSISLISEKCGFSDVKYYYSHFKRWFGCMPLEYKEKCFTYQKIATDYNNLELNSIGQVLIEYVDKYLTPYNVNSQNSEFSLFVENYPKIKYLYKMDKKMIPHASKNIVLDILNHSNFCIKNNHVIFNWYIIDQIVKLTNSLSFNLSIRLRADYMEEAWFIYTIEKFLDSCIFRYGIQTVSKWVFYLDYKGNELFNMTNAIRKIIHKRIKNAKISYYFEI
ncbi:helix-turn-helix transcriptional regulator [Clostridium sp. Cult2]|uniref:helix-turn-helix transcriptional regulator n=1 Tax=Clostridium sp. Cult2 TaxID=2079003 RepID=UPI001EFF841F|nr:helix-turn-helix domain-containing protein [Clostridium sp. Cult2]MCF6464320.1 hypothetical protein [Clostridium sp. Cult2]